jgi:hypothetical protein
MPKPRANFTPIRISFRRFMVPQSSIDDVEKCNISIRYYPVLLAGREAKL